MLLGVEQSEPVQDRKGRGFEIGSPRHGDLAPPQLLRAVVVDIDPASAGARGMPPTGVRIARPAAAPVRLYPGHFS